MMTTAEALQLMLAFGAFVVALLSFVVALIDRNKKQ
ncbi:putative holin-like toxin [Pilibacter termitis]|jgi:hypothetical protein|nr:putative holin-like toxin [Pilibacter termitis]